MTESLPKNLEIQYDQIINRDSKVRDKRTEALLKPLINTEPVIFISEACRAAGIEPPDGTAPLTPKILELQKYMHQKDASIFPRKDIPEGQDGKLGIYTYTHLIKFFPDLKKFARSSEIVAASKSRLSDLRRQVSQEPATLPAQTARQPEAADELEISANETALIGDSLTYGYRTYFNIDNQKIPTARDRRYVMGGKSVLEMLKDFNKLNAAGKLDNIKAIVIFGGANDLSFRTSNEIIGYLDAMKKAMLAKTPPARVVLVTLPPVMGYKGFGRKKEQCEQRVKEINNWIRMQAGPMVKVVDLYNQIVAQNNPGHMQAKYNGGDGLHFSGKGYKALAAAVKDAVQHGHHKDFDQYA
ncbi:SGNH/GDSL hydrolase family protein [Candidatus Peregrinibacteria bacterium]|nr:SGNH/GDSL hydrolase family protein [Candidatus Peregrinibacteria bacterium]